MKIELLFCSDPSVIVEGIRTCWKTQDKSDSAPYKIGENDKKLIRKIIQAGHESTFEHSQITYRLTEISRGVLQEISRHRVGVSPSVESTRYTFRRMLQEKEHPYFYMVNSGDKDLDRLNLEHMKKVKDLVIEKKLPNDVAKYGIVEAYHLTEVITFNVRSLRHFIKLRTSLKALKEIQEIARKMYVRLPGEMRIFFEDLIDEPEKTDKNIEERMSKFEDIKNQLIRWCN